MPRQNGLDLAYDKKAYRHAPSPHHPKAEIYINATPARVPTFRMPCPFSQRSN